MSQWLFIFLLGVNLALSRCGVEVGNPKNPTGGGGPKSVVATDSAAALEVIAGELDETAAAMADADSTTDAASLQQGAGLSLANAVTRTSACTSPSASSVAVEVSIDGTFSYDFGRLSNRKTVVGTDKFTRTAVWSDADPAVVCNASASYAVIDFRNLAALDLDVTFSRARSRIITRKATGVVLREGSFTASGSRHVAMASAAAPSSDRRRIAATITKDVTRRMQVTTAASGELDYTASIYTAPAAPLTVAHDYALASGDWVEKTITSGTLVSKHEDGSRVELTFADVVYTAANGCQPESGTIAGEVYDSTDVETAYTTFTVTFNSGGAAEVVFANGVTGTYEADGCGFEE